MAQSLLQAVAPVLRALGVREPTTHAGLPPPEVERLPDIEYPVPVIVKNTFIDADLGRPPSVDGFYTERQVHSCPTSTADLSWSYEEGCQPPILSKLRLGCLQEANGSSSSRSTSVGASSARSCVEDTPGSLPQSLSPRPAGTGALATDAHLCSRAAGCAAGPPEFDYPAPITIKNTFIHAGIGRAPSLDGFFQERRLRSCPGSAVEDPCTLAEDAQMAASLSSGRSARRACDDDGMASPGAGVCWPASIPPASLDLPEAMPAEQPIVAWPLVLPLARPQFPPPLARPQLPPQKVLLELSRVLEVVNAGSVELPSVGSVDHCRGTCRPCAHVHSAKGCKNGPACQFCHLCPPGELKRMQKAKRMAKQTVAASPPPTSF